MASGPPVMGFGRGGRGKSLKELLNQPVRKPGETPSQPKVRQLTTHSRLTQEINILPFFFISGAALPTQGGGHYPH